MRDESVPDAIWGILSGLFSGVLAAVASRALSNTERREDAMRKSYELLMKRVSQLERREGELEGELQELQKRYDELERRYLRLLRTDGWKDHE